MNQTFHVTLAITHDNDDDDDEVQLAEQAAQRAYNIQGVKDCQIVRTFVPVGRPLDEASYRSEQLPHMSIEKATAQVAHIKQQLEKINQLEKGIPLMTTHSIVQWFKLAVPNPTEKNRNVQVGCHIEEVAEMFDAMGEKPVAEKLDFIGSHYKANAEDMAPVDRDALLDSLCDQIVTAIGVAHMFGMNIEGALGEVNRSNYSKFVNGVPILDANGKIAKPPTYSKPNLAAFVGLA